MNSENESPRQSDTFQQQPPHSFNPRKPLAFFAAVFLAAIVSGIGGYLLGEQRLLSASPLSEAPLIHESSPPPSPFTLWKTYADQASGFSIQYPNTWNQVLLSDDTGGYLTRVSLTTRLPQYPTNKNEDLPGVLIETLKISNCSDSAAYLKREMDTYLSNKDIYPELQIRVLNLDNIFGYIIGSGAPGTVPQIGPEAFIFNCPIEIQITFNPTDIDGADKLFDQILHTTKVWNPR